MRALFGSAEGHSPHPSVKSDVASDPKCLRSLWGQLVQAPPALLARTGGLKRLEGFLSEALPPSPRALDCIVKGKPKLELTERRQPPHLADRQTQKINRGIDRTTNQPQQLLHSARYASTPSNGSDRSLRRLSENALRQLVTHQFSLCLQPADCAQIYQDVRHTPKHSRGPRIVKKGPIVFLRRLETDSPSFTKTGHPSHRLEDERLEKSLHLRTSQDCL